MLWYTASVRRNRILFLIFLVFLAACGSRVLSSSEEQPGTTVVQKMETPFTGEVTHMVTRTPPFAPVISPFSTPTFAVIRTPTRPLPTLTVEACMNLGGKVEVQELRSDLMTNPLVFRVYLPPCYDENPKQIYPVLYLIHGQTYTDTQWEQLGAPKTADKLFATGGAAPFIIVMPWDRGWQEPAKDNFGRVMEANLIPWIDAHYRTQPDSLGRAIGGLSRGGAWAVHLGFNYPELFSAVGVHSGFIFNSDAGNLNLWLEEMADGELPRIYIDIGDHDRPDMIESATWLEGMLTQYDIPHEWHMYAGEHEEAYWQAHLEDYLRWYSAEWGK